MTSPAQPRRLRRSIAIFHACKIDKWPAFMRRFFVLGFLPRKKLDDLPFEIKTGPYRFAGNATNLIDYHMLSRGAFEPGLARVMQDWADQTPKSIFLDVGANVGVHTLAIASRIAEIVAVEPFPPVADRLEATLKTNHIKNVTVARFALSHESGTVSFLAPDSGNLGVGRVVAGDTTPGMLQVTQTTGDELLRQNDLPLGLVKIDVEGFELNVLRGLQERLRRDRPLLVVEVLTEDAAHRESLKHLLPENYSFYMLESARRPRYRLLPWQSGNGDIVAIPTEHLKRLSV
ncbi:MAG: FkbM family methyltransferase [Parvibaculaceae bacterium]